jgi:MoxR-like ATPase
MNTGINAINEAVKEASAFTHPLFTELGKVVVGQHYLTERLVIGLLANGHVLLEGVPGLAKTLSVKSLAATLSVKFSRLQFTPDMLPADVIGTQIYNPQSGGFSTRKGPVFANLILADEINRAPAKVQSALLEAMQENRSPSATRPTSSKNRSSCSPRRIPSNRKARIRCPKHRLTASC